jgi:hypothetical protein
MELLGKYWWVLVIGAVLVWAAVRNRPRPASPNPYEDLRGLALANRAPGVVIDMGFAEGTATLVGLGDGTGSMYFSGGGGVIGGHAHAAARAAAIALTDTLGLSRDLLRAGPPAERPGAGRWRFYLLSSTGLMMSDEMNEAELESPSHPLHSSFVAAHALITELRLLSSTD